MRTAPRRGDAVSSGLAGRELAELHAQLGAQIAAATTSGDTLAAVTSVALTAVPGTDHASITRGRGDHFQTLAPTDDTATDADRLQYELNNGPCVESVRSDGPFLIADLATDGRWPTYGPLAAERFGVRSMISTSMVLLEDDMQSSLNLYSDEVNGFTRRSETVAMVLTTHATVAIGRMLARERARNLEIALGNSRVIGMAMGVLMSARKLTTEQAFALLQIASQNSNRKLDVIAEDVVETGMLADLA